MPGDDNPFILPIEIQSAMSRAIDAELKMERLYNEGPTPDPAYEYKGRISYEPNPVPEFFDHVTITGKEYEALRDKAARADVMARQINETHAQNEKLRDRLASLHDDFARELTRLAMQIRKRGYTPSFQVADEIDYLVENL